VLNNILKWSDLDPQSPNVIKPGRKAGTMMSPTQVFQDGAFVLSVGTPGLVRHPPDAAADAAERAGVRHERAGGDRGATHRVYRDRLLDAESRIPEDGARGAGLRVVTR
jgi:hypothetical protein